MEAIQPSSSSARNRKWYGGLETWILLDVYILHCMGRKETPALAAFANKRKQPVVPSCDAAPAIVVSIREEPLRNDDLHDLHEPLRP